VRRRVLQEAVAEGMVLLVYAFAWRLGGFLLPCWIGIVTVSLLISKSLISLHLISRQDGGLPSFDCVKHSQADRHGSPLRACFLSGNVEASMLVVTDRSRTCVQADDHPDEHHLRRSYMCYHVRWRYNHESVSRLRRIQVLNLSLNFLLTDTPYPHPPSTNIPSTITTSLTAYPTLLHNDWSSALAVRRVHAPPQRWRLTSQPSTPISRTFATLSLALTASCTPPSSVNYRASTEKPHHYFARHLRTRSSRMASRGVLSRRSQSARRKTFRIRSSLLSSET
jgi:hypothetical protein